MDEKDSSDTIDLNRNDLARFDRYKLPNADRGMEECSSRFNEADEIDKTCLPTARYSAIYAINQGLSLRRQTSDELSELWAG